MKRLFFISQLVFMIACQPSKITQSWTAKDAAPKKYKKVLVLGVLTDDDSEIQIKMEDHLADDLKKHGYPALAANKLLPAGTFVRGDTARAQTAIKSKGFDAVLTVVLLDKKKERYYIPGKITDNARYNQHGWFERYYNNVSERIYTPGYYGEETKYIWENNFYDLQTQQMIYSARTRSFDIVSKNTLAHAYGLLLANNLVKKNILVKPENPDEE